MRSPFSFEGPIGRAPFAWAAFALLAVQFVLAHMMVGSYWFHWTVAAPALDPLRLGWGMLFAQSGPGQELSFLVLLGFFLLTEWLLVALAFRRAATTGASSFSAAMVVVPYLQIVVAFRLAFLPALEDTGGKPDDPWRASAFGMLAATAIGVIGAAFFTLVIGDYGLGLFVATPLLMGIIAAYISTRQGGSHRTAVSATLGALLLSSLALLGFAIEGALCLVMASPLIILLGGIGTWLGRAWAKALTRRQARLMSFAALPLLLVTDALVPPHAVFESVESTEISATPAEVWDSVVHMGPIPDAPAAPFGWGLAYPMRGTIRGQGVGAIREGVFSTGTAYERVTAWEPGRKLDFIVLSDPPTMKELSPYDRVHAPHTEGYFKTRDARFTITPLANGKTRLTLATQHELDIGPSVYWQPWAEWAVHTNKRRVLQHFRNQAERAARLASRP